MSWEKRVLVTGGAGVIGSHFVRLVRERYPDWFAVNLELLTYAADLGNLAAVLGARAERGAEASGADPSGGELAYGERLAGQDPGHVLVRGDVADGELVRRLFGASTSWCTSPRSRMSTAASWSPPARDSALLRYIERVMGKPVAAALGRLRSLPIRLRRPDGPDRQQAEAWSRSADPSTP